MLSFDEKQAFFLPTSKDLIFIQPENAPFPTDVTESGIVTEVRDLQFENADSPIDVTEFGMNTDVRDSQFWNA